MSEYLLSGCICITSVARNMAGSHFPNVLSLLSLYPSECLHAIQNETIWWFLFSGMWISDRNGCSICLLPIIVLQKVLLGKSYCHDAKYTCLSKDLIYSDKYTVLNVQNLKAECPIDFCWNKFIMDNFIGIKRWLALFWLFILTSDCSFLVFLPKWETGLLYLRHWCVVYGSEVTANVTLIRSNYFFKVMFVQ
jgi:hypothetical protein